MQCCVGRWTWESGEKKSVIGYMFGKGLDVIKMVVEDSGNLDIGSDHNLIWSEVVWGLIEVEVRRERYKWRVDGRLGWEHYHEAVEEEFIVWEMEVRVIDEVREACLIEKVWRRWKEMVQQQRKEEKEKNDGEVREMVVRRGSRLTDA